VFRLTQPQLINVIGYCVDNTTGVPTEIATAGATCPVTSTRINGIKESFLGNSAKPRLSVGVGFNWTSPFGPIRLDVAKALLKQEGDDTKLFSFNVGTQF
jgi:outer membrane protein insertion porin family